MMLGIRFIIPNAYGQIIYDILKDANTKDFYWNIGYEDILIPPIQEDRELFEEKNLCDADFKRRISQLQYYVVFLSITAFSQKAQIECIHSFPEYFQSDCQLMIFITDAIFVDIYSKSEELINEIKRTAMVNSYQSIETIESLGARDAGLLPL